MLSRIYIDNFSCFVNFEQKPARKQLILGRNGSGKSSFLDTLLLIRQFVTKGDVLDDFFVLSKRTRWLDQSQQICEIEAELEEGKYRYRLVLDAWGEPARARVVSETVHFNDKPLLQFEAARSAFTTTNSNTGRPMNSTGIDRSWPRSCPEANIRS